MSDYIKTKNCFEKIIEMLSRNSRISVRKNENEC